MAKKHAHRRGLAPSGARWVLWVTVSVSLAIGAVLLVTRRSGTISSRSVNHPGSDAGSAETFATWRRSFTQMVASVAGDDAEAVALVQFFREHAVFGRVDRFRHFRFEQSLFIPPDSATRQRQDFAVVVCRKEECGRFGVYRENNWEYDVSRNLMLVPPPTLFGGEVGGVLLLHEVMHAYDILSGREPMGLERVDPEFAAGEVRAHSMEVRLFDRLTEGRYSRALAQVLDQYPTRTSLGWVNNDSPLVDILDATIDPLFPAARSIEESNSRRGRHFYALNMLLADRLGRGEQGKVAFMQWRFAVMDGLLQ